MGLVAKSINTVTEASELPEGITLRYDNTVCRDPNVITAYGEAINLNFAYGTTPNWFRVNLVSSDSDVYFYVLHFTGTYTPSSTNFSRLSVCMISDAPFQVSYSLKWRNYAEQTGTTNFTSQNTNLANIGLTGVYGVISYEPTAFFSTNFDLAEYTDPGLSGGVNTITPWYTNSFTVDPSETSPNYIDRSLYFSYTVAAYLMKTAGVVPDDPYDGIPDSDVDGGGGDFDDSSVPIDFPPLPAISVADGGFVTIYTPTLNQIKDVNNYLWQVYDPDPTITLPRILGSIMDIFIGLSILPIMIPHTNTKQVLLGGHATGLYLPVADSQFVDVSFGTLDIKTGTGGSYLDYSPYTKAQIFLPYIGFREISIDDIMGKTLELRYRVDIVSGACLALLKCGASVLYQWTGNCAINIPLTGVDYTNTYRSALSAVGHIGQVVAGVVGTASTGGAAAPIGLGVAGNGLAGLASDALNAKPEYPRSGSLGGAAGVMGHQMAYICLSRPDVIKPKNQQGFVGYPCFITYKIGDLEGQGFTQFSDVILDGVELTKEEIDDLTALLKGGVYL